MINDITPPRGAIRSTSRPPAARPIPAMTRQALDRPYGAPQPTVQSPVVTPAPSVAAPAPSPPVIQPVIAPQPVAPERPAELAPVVTPPPTPAALPVTPPPEVPPAPEKRKWYQFSKRRLFIMIPALIVISAGSFVGLNAWLGTYHAATPLTPVVQAAAPDSHKQSDEGMVATALPTNSLASYHVAPDLPRALTIEKLGVAARILSMGVNKDNSMQAPVNINDSGWYTGSSKPGAPGAMVIDGHSSATNSSVKLGLFNAIGALNNGDIVSVEKGDGTKLSYKVVAKETVALADIDMKKVMLPYGGATEGLNLITCAGQWTSNDRTLDHRTIVYTTRITT